MSPLREDRHDRREMFRGLARYAVLGGLGGLSAALIARRGTASCPAGLAGSTTCRGCPRRAHCDAATGLPPRDDDAR